MSGDVDFSSPITADQLNGTQSLSYALAVEQMRLEPDAEFIAIARDTGRIHGRYRSCKGRLQTLNENNEWVHYYATQEELEVRAWRRVDTQPKEAVNHPSHYNMGKIEVIDAIEDWKLGFNLGNAVKYIARAAHKGKLLEDLKKARFYLNRAIANIEKGQDA